MSTSSKWSTTSSDRQRATIAGAALTVAVLLFVGMMVVVPGGGLLGTATTFTLNVSVGHGGRSVTVTRIGVPPSTQTCTSACTYSYPSGSPLQISALADADFTFNAWVDQPGNANYGCVGSGASCSLTLNQNTSVLPSFRPNR